MKRRDFLSGLAAVGATSLVGCAGETKPALPPGSFVGPDHALGHQLRSIGLQPTAETRRHGIAIIGGGMAGLSAAWRLQRAGFTDFALYEMESGVGGNSRSGENAISAYPLGAHYLPLPSTEARAVRQLLSDLGVLQGDPFARTMRFDERFLCHAPQERLYRNGIWQEGLLPQQGLTATEQTQNARFIARMTAFREQRGRDGRRAFAIPMAYSSRDPALLALDRMSMRDWLLADGITSEPLHWYVDYACRDDYGTRAADTSAWAGIHYFACRNGVAQEAASDVMLTAPEGNGWIVRRLAEKLAPHLNTGALATRIGQASSRSTFANLYLPKENRYLRIEAAQLIFAAPTFTLPWVWPEAPGSVHVAARSIEHAPWLVANLSLSRLPQERRGAPLSWDNVLYDSPGLGYVVSTHQAMRTRPGPTVLTSYHALVAKPPAEARAHLLSTPHSHWAENILAELERVHPDIREITSELDIVRYGHAMAQPRPGSLWHSRREHLGQRFGNIQLAHADLSRFSLFEEANYHGVKTAERALAALGHVSESLL